MQSLPRKPKKTYMHFNYTCWNSVCHHSCCMFSHFSYGNVERCKVSEMSNRKNKDCWNLDHLLVENDAMRTMWPKED